MPVPKLRFPGFTDDWEQRKFGDTFAGLQNNTLSRADLNNESGIAQNVHYGDILVKFGEYIDASRDELPYITNESIVSKFSKSFLQDGDIIFADTAEDSTVGKCSEIVGSEGKTLISGLHTMAFRPQQQFAPKFLGYYLNSSAYHNQLTPLMQGIKVTSISKSAMQDTDMIVPKSTEEQVKIGTYFSDLDNLITLHRRECNELQELKKSMLQKMFPKEGETIPEIRFPGFTGDWEQRKFGNIANRMSETSLSSEELPYIEYEDVISNQGILNKDVSTKEGVKTGIVFSEEDVLYGKLRPYLHNWLNPDFKGVAVGDWWVLKPINVDKNFLYRLIQSENFDNVANQSTGTKMPRADWKLVSATEFCVPKSLKEQAEIGQYFTNLDNLITLHQRKCDELKELKKGLLQQMFC